MLTLMVFVLAIENFFSALKKFSELSDLSSNYNPKTEIPFSCFIFLFFLWKQYTSTLASLEYLCWKTFGVFVLKNFLFSQQKSRLFFDNHQPCPLLPIRHFHRKALSRSSFSAREQFSMQFIIGFSTTLFVGYMRKRKTVICLKNVGRNYVALTCSILDCMDHHPLALKTQYSGCF